MRLVGCGIRPDEKFVFRKLDQVSPLAKLILKFVDPMSVQLLEGRALESRTRLNDELEQGVRALVGKLDAQGHVIKEGSAPFEQLLHLFDIAKNPERRSIAEIGFNVGFSGYAFLLANKAAHVTSFDIASHSYVEVAKGLIDKHFPGRHRLIPGNSNKTVPAFASANPERKFDLIFIDGGHRYGTASRDIVNMHALAHPGTIVVMDDLVPWLPWGIGPSLAWKRAKARGIVREEERRTNGRYANRRTWAAGKYILD